MVEHFFKITTAQQTQGYSISGWCAHVKLAYFIPPFHVKLTQQIVRMFWFSRDHTKGEQVLFTFNIWLSSKLTYCR